MPATTAPRPLRITLTATALLAGGVALSTTGCATRAAYASPVAPLSASLESGLEAPGFNAPLVAPQSAGAAVPYGQSNRLSLLLGQRMLDDDYWSPAEDQLTFGVEFARESPGQPIGWELGAMYSTDDGSVLGFEFEGTTTEFYGGVRKTFLGETETVRPYVGGGVSLIRGKGEVSGFGSEDDTSIGGYVHGGVLARVTRTFALGVDARALFGTDIDLAGVSGDVDYFQVTLVLSWLF